MEYEWNVEKLKDEALEKAKEKAKAEGRELTDEEE